MSTALDTKINLLPPSEFELSFWGKFLKWAVTTGRYVIIVTELVVIIAFLSRFKLDSDLARQNEEIRSKKNFLDAQTATETRFLALQNQLVLADQIVNKSLNGGEEINRVVSTLPSGVKLKSLSINKNTSGVSVYTIENTNFGVMLKQMTKTEYWKNVDVISLTADGLEGIVMNLNLKR